MCKCRFVWCVQKKGHLNLFNKVLVVTYITLLKQASHGNLIFMSSAKHGNTFVPFYSILCVFWVPFSLQEASGRLWLFCE